jgi:hypothetical protein
MSRAINTLHNRIMRRVYYSFGLRALVHPVTLHVAVLALTGYVLTALVHVSAVYKNLLTVQVGELGNYVALTLMRADVATLVVLGVAIMTVLSLQWRLLVPHRTNRMVFGV